MVGFQRVNRVIDTVNETTYGQSRIDADGAGAALEVAGVDYSYVPGQRLLDGLDFTIEPGRTVAVVGATASGKSTLTSLVTRLVDPVAGAIRVDGHDLRDLERGALADHVSLVPQSAFLFDDTVRGNVSLGADISDAEVWDALRIAQADGFVANLAQGLDSRLGSAAPPSPVVSASACPWPARSYVGPGCSCSTTPRRRSIRRSRPGSWLPWGSAEAVRRCC